MSVLIKVYINLIKVVRTKYLKFYVKIVKIRYLIRISTNNNNNMLINQVILLLCSYFINPGSQF